jgi:hypothetical protein
MATSEQRRERRRRGPQVLRRAARKGNEIRARPPIEGETLLALSRADRLTLKGKGHTRSIQPPSSAARPGEGPEAGEETGTAEGALGSTR